MQISSRGPTALYEAATSYLQRAGDAITTAAKDAAKICRNLYANARELASAAWSRTGLSGDLVGKNIAAYRPMSNTITEAPELHDGSASARQAAPAARHRETAGVGARLLQLTSRIFGRDAGPERANGPGLRAAAQAALKDPKLHFRVQERVMVSELKSFFASNLDVCLSEQFWQHPKAQTADDSFGCLMSLIVIEGMVQKGKVTQEDLHNMRRAIEPYQRPADWQGREVARAPVLGEHLVGPLDDAKLSEIANAVYRQFLAKDAPIEMNGAARTEQNDESFYKASSAEKLSVLEKLTTTILETQDVSLESVTEPLQHVASLTPAS